MKSVAAATLLLINGSYAFSMTKSIICKDRSPFIVVQPSSLFLSMHKHDEPSMISRIFNRFDTLEAAGLKSPDQPPVLLARGGGFKRTVILLLLAFAYKWYRARFINKIPVWDRQPQWNMVITSKEQEKDLRAYTCKNCGSTLFIAKNREWFFEGDTGLAGLGCYACGAKGKDNFVMDRERIVEDVGAMDDYFDYERPLDFVTAAERRALLKKAQGNEALANEMLVAQEKASSGAAPASPVLDAEVAGDPPAIDDVPDVETDVVDQNPTNNDSDDAPEVETEVEIINPHERRLPLSRRKSSPNQKIWMLLDWMIFSRDWHGYR